MAVRLTREARLVLYGAYLGVLTVLIALAAAVIHAPPMP